MTSAILVYFCSCLLPGASPEALPVTSPDTLVICAPALRLSLQPWIDYRTGQGHRLQIVTHYDSAMSIRSIIRQVAGQGELQHVLLVGDVQPGGDFAATHVPTYLAVAEINSRWGSEPHIATDNWFADLDDDLSPDLSIGRIPADSPAQLSAIVRKIIRYEQASASGAWQRRVNLVAGVGGFGVVADTVLETATRSFISRGIPEGYRTSLTYASWRSPFCPDPRAFRQQVIERMNEGCLCWVYIGHGFREGLDWVRVPPGVAPILTTDDVDRVACRSGAPIALFLSCYGVAFDGPQDCLGERLLARPEGPVAVMGGTRVTMPYGMAVLSQEMMGQMFDDRAPTLGQVLLEAKRRTLAPDADRQRVPWLDTLARALSPNPDDLEGERREHVLMFHLLGDPLTRINHARHVDIDIPRFVRSGESLAIRCRSDVVGSCTVELVSKRGRLTFRPEPRLQFDGTHEGMQKLTQVYIRANDDRYSSLRLEGPAAEFQGLLAVPATVDGPCAVRVFVRGNGACAVGAASVSVSQATADNAEEQRVLETIATPAATPVASP